MAESRMSLYCVLVVGNKQTGKSHLLKKLTTGMFSENYKETKTVNFSLLPSHNTDSSEKTLLQLWDIPSNDLNQGIMKLHCENKHAAIICYDPSNPESINKINDWVTNIRLHSSNMLLMLLSMKSDQALDKTQDQQTLAKIANQQNIPLFFQVSAKNGDNITSAFEALKEHIHEKIRKEIKDIQRIDTALHKGQTTLFTKSLSWLNAKTEDKNKESLPQKIKELIDTPHQSTKHDLHTKHPHWDNPSSNDYEEHRKRLIIDTYNLAYEQSGLFKKPARQDLNKKTLLQIEELAVQKPESRLGKIVKELGFSEIYKNNLPKKEAPQPSVVFR